MATLCQAASCPGNNLSNMRKFTEFPMQEKKNPVIPWLIARELRDFNYELLSAAFIKIRGKLLHDGLYFPGLIRLKQV